MSESRALATIAATIPMTLERPARVTPRQWRLAALLPRCETAYQALKDAGYAESTARDRTRDISVAVGTRRAMAAIQTYQESERDKASELLSLSVAKVTSRIKDDSASDVLLLGAITKANELKQSLPDQSQEASLPPSWYRQQRRRALLRAYQLGRAAAAQQLQQQQD